MFNLWKTKGKVMKKYRIKDVGMHFEVQERLGFMRWQTLRAFYWYESVTKYLDNLLIAWYDKGVGIGK